MYTCKSDMCACTCTYMYMYILVHVCCYNMQALLFYFPVFVWRSATARSGLDLNMLIETGESFQVADKVADKEQNLEHMTQQMTR